MKKLISICWFIFIAAAHAVEVTAQLSGETIPAGQGVMLTLTVEGGTLESHPTIPEVKDLIINPRGTSQQMRMVNGDVTRSIAFTYVVGSNKAGDYEVPVITVRVSGKDYTTQSLKLKVGPSPDAEPDGMAEEQKTEAPGKYGHLSFKMISKDRKYVYPGEIAPVKIQAFFPADARVSLNSTPRPEGSAFTLHNLSERPSQSSEVIDGQRYLVVTWFGGLSATKAGEYPASFKISGTVVVRDESAQRRPSAFDDPFFGRSMLDDFFAPMVQKDIELSTEDAPPLEVRELPKEGRPADFTGAIGEFEFQSASIPGSLKTGEPFQVEAVVKGSGNFSLLSAPQPFPERDWKTYSGSDNFVPEDVASFGGTKTFRYNAIPLKPGEAEVGLGFSFFDPEKGEYREVRSATGKVVITGEVVQSTESAETKEPINPKPKAPELAPLATELGAVGDYEPLSSSGWFIPVAGGCGFLSLGILGVGWWKSREVDAAKEARKAHELALREALHAADEAVIKGDALAFFQSAKNAIQLSVSERAGIKPEAVTLADLHGENAAIADILVEADRVDYSGKTTASEDLIVWKSKLEQGLANLDAQRKEQAA